MLLYNIKENDEQVSFKTAVRQGLGKNQGLFFPKELPLFSQLEINKLLDLDFISRSKIILKALIGDEYEQYDLDQAVENAFNFPAKVEKVTNNIFALELFHGPTLAFKDFGGRFMAQTLKAVSNNEKITILTATSGDTGAAVAHAFYGIENIEVVVLYPKGKISTLQEKLFATLGNNIKTIAIDGSFDDCQALVKQAFDDESLRQTIGLNSANSINISRLLAQVCYYFEAVKAVRNNKEIVVSVPSGNFGNLTAGLIAKAIGLPIKRFIASTNSNDTVPRFLQSGKWSPNATIATLSNAMDVSRPNNWPRVEELFKIKGWDLIDLTSTALNDEQTKTYLKKLYDVDYLCEPHGAIAYGALTENLSENETGVFLCTAHSAKFKESVDNILDLDIKLPKTLAEHSKLPLLSVDMKNSFEDLKSFLIK